MSFNSALIKHFDALRRHSLWRWLVAPLVVLLFVVAPIYDERFPVITEFHVTAATLVPGRGGEGMVGELRIDGVMDKSDRWCTVEEFIAVIERRGEPKVLSEIFEQTPDGMRPMRVIIRPPGRQSFGPWFVPLPRAAVAVDIFTRHKCWPAIPTLRYMPVWRRGS